MSTIKVKVQEYLRNVVFGGSNAIAFDIKQ